MGFLTFAVVFTLNRTVPTSSVVVSVGVASYIGVEVLSVDFFGEACSCIVQPPSSEVGVIETIRSRRESRVSDRPKVVGGSSEGVSEPPEVVPCLHSP